LNNNPEIVGFEPWLLRIDGVDIDLPQDFGTPLSARLATLQRDEIVGLRARDLHIVQSGVEIGDVLDSVSTLIRAAPSLESIVKRCAQEILILRASDDFCDVSHSEPRWPTRIFISIPSNSEVGRLRVAESVVHEAMHLNLTFLERQKELVAKSSGLYSPWKRELRPASGILHGLYVFACIQRFLVHVSGKSPLSSEESRHIDRRCKDICAEARSINRESLLACLTPAGSSLANCLFAIIKS
jgi:HEXXH motif-containing protein